MEFDGLFDDHSLSKMVNNGAIGLEYLRRHQRANNEDPLSDEVVMLIKQGSEACRLLLKAFEVYKKRDESRAWTAEQIAEYQLAERFLRAAEGNSEFELISWKKEARAFRAKISGFFQGRKQIPTEEIEALQHFLNIAGSIMLRSIMFQTDAYVAARGVHTI